MGVCPLVADLLRANDRRLSDADRSTLVALTPTPRGDDKDMPKPRVFNRPPPTQTGSGVRDARKFAVPADMPEEIPYSAFA